MLPCGYFLDRLYRSCEIRLLYIYYPFAPSGPVLDGTNSATFRRYRQLKSTQKTPCKGRTVYAVMSVRFAKQPTRVALVGKIASLAPLSINDICHVKCANSLCRV